MKYRFQHDLSVLDESVFEVTPLATAATGARRFDDTEERLLLQQLVHPVFAEEVASIFSAVSLYRSKIRLVEKTSVSGSPRRVARASRE